MGYQIADLFLFLKEIAGRRGVRAVWLYPYKHPAEILVEVAGGLSETAYDERASLYSEFEQHFANYRVAQGLEVDYRIIPVGNDLGAAHIPDGAIPIHPTGRRVAAG